MKAISASILAALLMSGPTAFAATDDAAITTAIVEGRYEVIPSLEEAAKTGDPIAMHWWAVLLDACAVDRCRSAEARDWWLKAAQVGNPRARRAVFSRHAPEATAVAPFLSIGEPKDDEERLVWSLGILGSLGMDRRLEEMALTFLREMGKREPTMLAMYAETVYGRGNPTSKLRTLLTAGTPLASEVSEALRGQYLLREGKNFRQLVKMAQEGDEAVAVALCETTARIDGNSQLPGELLPLCLASFERGHIGLADVLLRHYLERDDKQMAGKFADWCRTLPVSCSDSLSEYEDLEFDDAQVRRDKSAVRALATGVRIESPLSTEVRRAALSLKVRNDEVRRACLMRRYLPDEGTFAETAECPWGKPIRMGE